MMDNNKFWEQYKALCSQKGLDAGTLEEFNARQTPPPTFSVDMLVEEKKTIVPNAGVFKEIVPLKRGVGRPPKNRPRIDIEPIGDEPLHVKETPLLKESKNVSMSEIVFHEIIIMAYKRGMMQSQEVLGSLITQEDLPVILDDVLGGKHV